MKVGARTKSKVGAGTKSKTHKRGRAEDKKESKSRAKQSALTARTFGVPVWEFFYILMAETNKDLFFTYLRCFRDNLKRYGLVSLLDYFERYYFAPDRIKQWASWYRASIFGCDWILDTNMHVESWHNILKTRIMERKQNTRIEKLMQVLRTAETMYFWKWQRTKYGIRQSGDKRWLAMRREQAEDGSGNSLTHVNCPTESEQCYEPEKEIESRSQDYKLRICELLEECKSLIHRKDVDPTRLKVMLKQQKAMCNVLRNSLPSFCTQEQHPRTPTLIQSSASPTASQQVPCFTSLRKPRTNVKIRPVKEQYKFPKKTRRIHVTNVKSFRKASNRSNLVTSFKISGVGGGQLNTPESFAETKELKLTLSVKKRGTRMSLDGIVFYPVIAGIVVPDDERGFESLNMRVAVVNHDSVACRAGVTSQHYLYKMRVLLGRKTRFTSDEIHIIGSSNYRNE